MKSFVVKPLFKAMALLTIPMLAACGSDSDDNDNSTETPAPQLSISSFIDSPVANLSYVCRTAQGAPSNDGVTDEKGNFEFNKGDTCDFMLNEHNVLGSLTLNTIPDYISPYSLGDSQKAARIASLLQTLDKDGDATNNISLNEDDLSKLPAIDLTSDAAYESSLQEAATTEGLSQSYHYVDLVDAKAHMDSSISDKEEELAGSAGGYYSEHVDQVVQRVAVEEAKNWSDTNFETELADYEKILNEKDSSNGKDREMMLALLTLMKVTNDPIVSARITPENKAGYTDMLPQVLDIILRGATFDFKDPQGITSDVAQLMGKYAVEAATAADMLGRSFNSPERVAVYGINDEFVVNYDQAMAIRASAMALASGLNILASYDYGSDEHLLPQTFSGDVPVFSVTCSWDGSTEVCEDTDHRQYGVEFDYNNAGVDPASVLKQENFVKLGENHTHHLQLAKVQLLQAAELAQKVTCHDEEGELSEECSYYIPENEKAMIAELQLHLTDSKKQPTVKLYDSEYEPDYKYMELNLHPFFDVGVDRSNFVVKESGWCGFDYTVYDSNYNQSTKRYQPAATTPDLEFSKSLDYRVCRLTDSEVDEVIATGHYNEGLIERGSNIYMPAVPYNDESEFLMKNNSTADQVLVKCVSDGQEVDCLPTAQ